MAKLVYTRSDVEKLIFITFRFLFRCMESAVPQTKPK